MPDSFALEGAIQPNRPAFNVPPHPGLVRVGLLVPGADAPGYFLSSLRDSEKRWITTKSSNSGYKRGVNGRAKSSAVLVGLLLGFLSGCAGGENHYSERRTGASTGVVTVYVVNYPLKYFAERIGSDKVTVELPVPEDQDPAFWHPAPKTIAAYQEADLILLNGASYAKWTKTTALPESRLVDTSAAFHDRYIETTGALTHAHGPGVEHAHAGIAFTTWLDPTLAIVQADAIRAALTERRPQYERTFRANFEMLKSELAELDAAIAERVSGHADRLLIFSHPVYQYLIRRYDLQAKSVHWEPEIVPSSDMWEEYEELAGRHPARWMIWEADPSAETASRLRQHGVESAVFDPCANVPASGDYMQVMRRNVDNLARVFDG